MFVVLLKFSSNKANASRFMDGHKGWLKDGFDEGKFVLAGTIQPNLGGAIIAHSATLEEMQAIVGRDPFVAENVVTADIIEITPSKASEQFSFLLSP